MVQIWQNDQPINQIKGDDRGLAYGDGLFATMLVNNKQIQYLEYHLKRLQDGAERLGFYWKIGKNLRAALHHLAQNNDLSCIKLQVTRGSGGRGYTPPINPSPIVIVSCHALPSHYDDWRRTGVKLTHSQVHLAQQPLLAGIKHLNRLEQVLVKSAVLPTSADEFWVSDTCGNIIESAIGNLFFIHGNEVFTPRISFAGVAGVMREQLIYILLQMGFKVNAIDISWQQVQKSEFVLMTNSLVGICPVTQIDEYAFTIWPRLTEIVEQLI